MKMIQGKRSNRVIAIKLQGNICANYTKCGYLDNSNNGIIPPPKSCHNEDYHREYYYY
jgi:hypothetical protein